MLRYNDDTSTNKENNLFVFSEFPEAYVQELEKIVYPEWYAACFMAECSNSSVWGHYGDNHKGVCLIYNVKLDDDNKSINLNGIHGWGSSGPIYNNAPHRFHMIDYEKKYVEVDFFKSLGRLTRPVLNEFWFSNEQGETSSCAEEMNSNEDSWRNRYWENFFHGVTTKLKDWQYEKEYRLIISNMLFDFSDSERRKLKYNFKELQGIIFGIKTSAEDKLKILKIIEKKCLEEKREDFKIYQAYYSPHKGIIDYSEMNLLKFEQQTEAGQPKDNSSQHALRP